MKFSLLLIAIFSVSIIVFLFNGCAHEQVSEHESRHRVFGEMRISIQEISDSRKATQLLRLVDLLEEDVSRLNQTVQEFGEELRDLNADYDTTREEFLALFDEFNSARKELQQSILTTYMNMKSLTTVEEWKEIAKLEEEALSKSPRWNLLDEQ